MHEGAIVLDRSAFKTALRRVANDPNFGKELNERPGTALKSIGLALPTAVVDELDQQPLSRTIEQAFGPPHEGPRQEAIVLVSIGVNVRVEVGVEVNIMSTSADDEVLDDAITNAAASWLGKVEIKD